MMDTKKKIFVSGQLNEESLNVLKESGYQFSMHHTYLIEESDFVKGVEGVHGILSFGPQQVTEKILDAAGPQLEVVSTMSVGVDAIDLKALKQRNIKLGHTPGVLTDAVANLAVTLVLACDKKVIEKYNCVKSWKSWKVFENLDIGFTGRTIGIVGLGRIGEAVARRLIPFGIGKILYYSRTEKKEAASKINAVFVPFNELLEQSDYVICCCSMNKDSNEMFNGEAFSKMKSTSVFVNIGRGAMVNQEALVDALRTNKIKAAGLDVTTPEPLPMDHPLLSCSNCIVLPHVGSAEIKTRTDMAVMAVTNLVSALNGEQMSAEYKL